MTPDKEKVMAALKRAHENYRIGEQGNTLAVREDVYNMLYEAATQWLAEQDSGEWQTIESAPRDKWLLLGYYNQLGKWRTVRGNWFENDDLVDVHEEPYDSEAGWYETVENCDDLPNVWPINPTHWQPLPPPPALDKGE